MRVEFHWPSVELDPVNQREMINNPLICRLTDNQNRKVVLEATECKSILVWKRNREKGPYLRPHSWSGHRAEPRNCTLTASPCCLHTYVFCTILHLSRKIKWEMGLQKQLFMSYLGWWLKNNQINKEIILQRKYGQKWRPGNLQERKDKWPAHIWQDAQLSNRGNTTLKGIHSFIQSIGIFEWLL